MHNEAEVNDLPFLCGHVKKKKISLTLATLV